MNIKRNELTAVSLFSGAGGLDIGIKQAGFNILACLEIDPNCCNTLRNAVSEEHTSTKIFEGDIRNISPTDVLKDVNKNRGEIDLLFGGPPCQSFSLIGKQKALSDARGMLLFQMPRFAEALSPKVVLMEQVKGVLSAKDQNGERGGVIRQLIKSFNDIGYEAKFKVMLAADYGVPQMRERLILVATKGKNNFEFPVPTHSADSSLFGLKPYKTVGDVLKGLGVPAPKIPRTTLYDDIFRNHVDVTPIRDRDRIKNVPEGKCLSSQSHLPKEILGGLSPKDTTKFLRLNREKPSNTLRCGEIFFHPTEDRYLTPREYMRIHGYPDSYLLKGPIRSRTGSVKNLDQHRQVANSVPPPLARAVAEKIANYIKE